MQNTYTSISSAFLQAEKLLLVVKHDNSMDNRNQVFRDEIRHSILINLVKCHGTCPGKNTFDLDFGNQYIDKLLEWYEKGLICGDLYEKAKFEYFQTVKSISFQSNDSNNFFQESTAHENNKLSNESPNSVVAETGTSSPINKVDLCQIPVKKLNSTALKGTPLTPTFDLQDDVPTNLNTHSSLENSYSINVSDSMQIKKEDPVLLSSQKNIDTLEISHSTDFDGTWVALPTSFNCYRNPKSKKLQTWLNTEYNGKYNTSGECQLRVQFTRMSRNGNKEKHFMCRNEDCKAKFKLVLPSGLGGSMTWNVYWNQVNHLIQSDKDEMIDYLSAIKERLETHILNDAGVSFIKAFRDSCKELNIDGADIINMKEQARNYFKHLQRSHRYSGGICFAEQAFEYSHQRSVYSYIKSSYIPRNDFKDLDELMSHMVTEPVEKDFPLFIPVDPLEDSISAGLSQEEITKVMSSFIYTSFSHIWTLFQFINIDQDKLHIVHLDECLGFVPGTFQVLTAGLTIIDGSAKDQDRLTRHFVPLGHIFTSCLKSISVYIFLHALDNLSKSLFGKPLYIHTFITDYSHTIRKGCCQYNKNANLCICFSHIIGSFEGKGGWVKKYSNKENIQTLRKHTTMLYECVTHEQFALMFEHFFRIWKEMGEDDWATFFNNMYGPTSPCNGKWYTSCTGVAFYLPNNNPLENYWSELKGKTQHNVAPIIRTNMNLSQFLAIEVPMLIQHDAKHRTYESQNFQRINKRSIRLLDTVTLTIASLIDMENDVAKIDRSDGIPMSILDAARTENPQNCLFFVNRAPFLGSKITQNRIQAFLSLLMGRQYSCTRNDDLTSDDDICYDAFGFCMLTLMDGDSFPFQRMVPNMEIYFPNYEGVKCMCRQYLTEGRCPASIFLQDKMGILSPSLTERLQKIYSNRPNKLPSKRRRYSRSPTRKHSPAERKYFGIPSESKLPPAIEFLFNLSDKQLLAVHQLRQKYCFSMQKSKKNRAEQLSDIVHNTWMKTYLQNMSQPKSDASYRSHGMQVRFADHDQAASSLESSRSSTYSCKTNDHLQETNKNPEIMKSAEMVQICPLFDYPNPVADVIHDVVDPSSCIAYLQDSAQGDTKAHIDTNNTCVLMSLLGVAMYLVNTKEEWTPATREGVKYILLSLGPEVLSSEEAQSLRSDENSMMHPDEVETALNKWMKGRVPCTLKGNYTASFLASKLAIVDGTDFVHLRDVILEFMHNIGSMHRVAATCFVDLHQFLIIRCDCNSSQKCNINGIDEDAAQDYKYQIIDTLPFPMAMDSTNKYRCVRYCLRDINALLRWLQRRCSYTAQMIKSYNRSVIVKGSFGMENPRDQFTLTFYSVNQPFRGPCSILPSNACDKKLGSLIKINESHIEHSIGSVSTATFQLAKKINTHFQKVNTAIYEEGKQHGSNHDDILLQIEENSSIPTEIIMQSEENNEKNDSFSGTENSTIHVPSQKSKKMTCDLYIEVLKSVIDLWKRKDLHVLDAQPWLQFPNHNHEFTITNDCLEYARQNRKKIDNMSSNMDIRTILCKAKPEINLLNSFLNDNKKASMQPMFMNGRSFSRLCSPNWLDDDNLLVFMGCIAKSQNCFVKRKSIHFFSPTWYPLFLQSVNIRTLNPSLLDVINANIPDNWECKKSLRAKEMFTHGEYSNSRNSRKREVNIFGNQFMGSVFPINMNSCHWITVIAWNESKTLYLYDLLNPTGRARMGKSVWFKRCQIQKDKITRAYHERLLDFLADYLNEERTRRTMPTITWSTEIVATKCLQKDGHNCGVIVAIICWMVTYLGHPPTMSELEEVDFSENSLVLARCWMAHSILKGSLWLSLSPLLEEDEKKEIMDIYNILLGKNKKY